MRKTVAFDVDGTLIEKAGTTGRDVPRYEVILMLVNFGVLELDIFVWSGSGVDYAKQWVEKLGLDNAVKVVAKGSFKPDIAIDDEDVELGVVNLKV